MAFEAGLVSVSFRKLSPREIVELTKRAMLSTIEWGGDIHVPPGDLDRAREVRTMTVDAGLKIQAYGSYVRLGDDDPKTYDPVIESAVTLGAPSIRVWAGRRASKNADADYRKRVADAALAFAGRAAKAKVVICYEYHDDTLTDTDESAQALFEAAEHPSIRTLWQPPHEQTVEKCCDSLRGVLPILNHVHVFHWPVRGKRLPLTDGEQRWRAYVEVLRESHHACPMLLEFAQNDDPEQLILDAEALRAWIQ